MIGVLVNTVTVVLGAVVGSLIRLDLISSTVLATTLGAGVPIFAIFVPIIYYIMTLIPVF